METTASGLLRKSADTSDERPSPFRALVWKEWRESWWLLVAATLAPAAWWAVGACWMDGWWATRTAWVLTSFLASLLGARLFAAETANGTGAFQDERPVERGTVWAAKMLLPLCATLAGGALLIVGACRLAPGAGLADRAVQWELAWTFVLAAVSVLFFSCAALCSVLLDRTATALAAGIVLFFLIATIEIAGPHEFFDMEFPRTVPLLTGLLAAMAAFNSLVVLALGRYAYVRWRRG